jgi:hypothetical protein
MEKVKKKTMYIHKTMKYVNEVDYLPKLNDAEKDFLDAFNEEWAATCHTPHSNDISSGRRRANVPSRNPYPYSAADWDRENFFAAPPSIELMELEDLLRDVDIDTAPSHEEARQRELNTKRKARWRAKKKAAAA